MATVQIDIKQSIGRMKPVHGVGQPPHYGLTFPYFHYLKEAGIPYSRLHDMGSYHGGRLVDIHCVFPNSDADPENPDSYDFAFTDQLIAALVKNGVEPFWRLGETIENYCYIKAYNIHPPKDNLKWAKICEGIIRHYTEGWANGFKYKIEHWEIWNEPDNAPTNPENQMWTGTMEEYFELYRVSSKYLKERFPHLKIGGYASCGFYAVTGGDGGGGNCTPRHEYFVEFFDKFLDYVKKNDCPLDFFSWHTYEKDLEKIRICAQYARNRLDEMGFTETTTSCNEWNCCHDMRGTTKHAAMTAAVLSIFQNEAVDTACFYDARLGPSLYGGMFNPMTHEPLCSYYTFGFFNELYKLGTQVKAECTDDKDVYCVSACDGKTVATIIVNTSASVKPIKIELDGRMTECKLLAEKLIPEDVACPAELPPESVLLIKAEI